jgi:DNA-directed RNA polymerase subunit RPC12/RpoP
MGNTKCLCLGCGRILMLSVRGEAEVAGRACPYCSGRLVPYRQGSLDSLYRFLGGGG